MLTELLANKSLWLVQDMGLFLQQPLKNMLEGHQTKKTKPYSSMQVQWPGIENISGQQQLPKNVKDAPVTPWYIPAITIWSNQ